ALGIDHVAGAALPLVPENLLAVGRIALRRRINGRAAQPVDVRDDFPDLIVRALAAERRHLGLRNAVLHRVEALGIGHPIVPPRRRGDGRRHFSRRAVFAVAGGARLVVNRLSFLNRLLIADGGIRRTGWSPAAATALRGDARTCGDERRRSDY